MQILRMRSTALARACVPLASNAFCAATAAATASSTLSKSPYLPEPARATTLGAACPFVDGDERATGRNQLLVIVGIDAKRLDGQELVSLHRRELLRRHHAADYLGEKHDRLSM